ncbi:MAG: GIY-YIG nuclease family protein [Ruminococcus sp.]|nr:GIY-YIG nuclease family protein [Ruminococcus sp.]
MIKHFGLNLRETDKGFKLTRDKYATIDNKSSFHICFKSMSDCYTDESGRYYTDEWCQKHQANCLKNFDLSMQFFSLLDESEFNNEITAFLKRNKRFKAVSDLNKYDVSGIYIMVLDEYKQLYVGASDNIKRRIRQHWTKNKAFDRLLFPIGAVETSVMHIDSFRAFDTTRLYAYKCKTSFEIEQSIIEQFSPKFLCNRIGGGKFGDSLSSAIHALTTMKIRYLQNV